MQRQSLGSPGPKLPHGGALGMGSKDDARLAVEEENRRCSHARPSADDNNDREDDDRQKKPQKHLRSSPRCFIHLIPLLTFLCFLVLYLCSHDPSLPDAGVGEVGRFVELDKGDVMMIRSLRNLQGIIKQGDSSSSSSSSSSSTTSFHRKLGH